MACWVSRQSVPCDFCQIARSLHLKHQMGVSSEWSRPVMPGQLVSALGAALKSWGHAAEMYLSLSLQDTSVYFQTWMSLWNVVLRTLWVVVITRLFTLFFFFLLWVSEGTESIVQLMTWFALDIIANFGILPFLPTRAPPQELLVPAHWGYMSTGNSAHGFVVDFDSWAIFQLLNPLLYLNMSFLQPTFRPFDFIPVLLTQLVKKKMIGSWFTGQEFTTITSFLPTWIWEISVFTS